MRYRKFQYIFVVLYLINVFALNVSAQSSSESLPAEKENAVAPLPEPSATTSSAIIIEPSKPPEKRLFGVVPNYRTTDASAPYVPLTPRQKLGIATHDSFDWPSYPLAAVMTFAMPDPKETRSYGTGWSGFGNRYIRSSADQIIGNMLTEGFMPTLLHEDPRYFRSGTGTFWSRLGTAITQIVVARKDSGGRTFNAAEFLGNAIAVGISNSYSPNLRSSSSSTEKLGLMIGTDMFSNVVKEFGPDVKEHLFHRHHQGT